jgi:hypothetical protein
MDSNKKYILRSVKELGELTPSQFSRLLFDSKLIESFDLLKSLSELKEDQCLEQKMTLAGIVYTLTQKGKELSGQNALSDDNEQRFQVKANEYKKIFNREKDYIALYSEQSTALSPVFLSIRNDDKILIHLMLMVDGIDSAKEITKNWLQNADKTYDAVWEIVAGGQSKPKLIYK